MNTKKIKSVIRDCSKAIACIFQVLFSFAVVGGIIWWWFGPALVHLFGALYYFGVFLWRVLIIPVLCIGGLLAAVVFVFAVVASSETN